jgi:hypothetical protein
MTIPQAVPTPQADPVSQEAPLSQAVPKENIIPEGQRNCTLSHRAGQLVKLYGDTEQARTAFEQEAAKCNPPLDGGELNTIWGSAQRFFHDTIEKQPDYVPPEKYAVREFTNPWALPIKDAGAMAELTAEEPKYRKFSIAAARLFLRAFGVTMRINDMNKRAEIDGLPDVYSGEDAVNLLPTLIADAASALAYKRSTNNIINDVLAVVASENRYHPVIQLINAEPWDGADRLSEICRMLGLSDEFHITIVKKWALQTIAVLYNTDETPIAAQGVLVLQGAQGIGKTQFFRHLAINERFFKGGATLDMSNKDSLLSATKVWICELGEVDSVTKKEQSALKAFLTEQNDRFREPYARNETVRPRRTSFCGTVNPKGYLRDETGNRRYWTIPVERIDIEKVFEYPPEWYAQFWRQIHAEYLRDKKSYLLTADELDKVNGRNGEFEAEIFGEDEFMTVFDIDAKETMWAWQTAAQIAKTLNESYKGLFIRSENVGGRLIPRIEKRTELTFLRKVVRGRRLIFCPPKRESDFDDFLKEPVQPLTREWFAS